MRLALTIWNVVTLAAILIILSLTLRYTLQVSLIRQIDTELDTSARHIAMFLGRQPEMLLRPPRRQPPDNSGQFGGAPPADVGPSNDLDPNAYDRQGPPLSMPDNSGDDDNFGQDMGDGGPPPPPPPPPGSQNPRPDPIRRWRQDVMQSRNQPFAAVYLSTTGKPFPVFSWMTPYDKEAVRLAAAGQITYSSDTFDGEMIRVQTFPIISGHTVFAVGEIAQSEEGEINSIAALQNTLWLLAPLGLLIAGIGGLLLASTALRPVGEIAIRTERIGAAQLSERLPVVGGDEFAHLAQTINRMLARIEESYVELSHSYEQQQQFTADASHELRTPLAIIKANTSLALMGNKSQEEMRQALVNFGPGRQPNGTYCTGPFDSDAS